MRMARAYGGGGCKDVVTRLSAVSKALDRAGFANIATGMEQCLAGGEGAMDTKELEKLFPVNVLKVALAQVDGGSSAA